MRDLNRIKRDDILPRDLEREIHEKEEHETGDNGFELEMNDKREMEGLENALEGIGEAGGDGKREREGALLDSLEERLRGLETALRT